MHGQAHPHRLLSSREMLPASMPSSPACSISLLQGQGRKTFPPSTWRESDPRPRTHRRFFHFPTGCHRALHGNLHGWGQGYLTSWREAWGIPGGIGVSSGQGDQPQVGKPKGRERAGAAPGKGEGARPARGTGEAGAPRFQGMGQVTAPVFGPVPRGRSRRSSRVSPGTAPGSPPGKRQRKCP